MKKGDKVKKKQETKRIKGKQIKGEKKRHRRNMKQQENETKLQRGKGKGEKIGLRGKRETGIKGKGKKS